MCGYFSYTQVLLHEVVWEVTVKGDYCESLQSEVMLITPNQ